MISAELQQAIENYLTGEATARERELVNDWYSSFSDAEIEVLAEGTDVTSLREAIRRRIGQRLEQTLEFRGTLVSGRRLKTRVLRVAAAAAILLLLTGGWWAYRLNTHRDTGTPVASGTKNDLPPGTTMATLTLADGQKLPLNGPANGHLATQGNVVIDNHQGAITYKGGGSNRQELFNTLSTGRGQQSPVLVLSDGTKVWLNAASSIRYPVVFGNSRTVTVTGEAWFEVAKMPGKPFMVETGTGRVEVLGTTFDLLAYPDEPGIKATLVEGSILFGSGKQLQKLLPGEQGQLLPDGKLTVQQNVDLDMVAAWKNGMQSFSNADIGTIMRQVGRWYDVDIRYEGKIPSRTFSGDIPRTANLTEVLRLFDINQIHYQLDTQQRILTIKP